MPTSSEVKTCQNCKQSFAIDASDFSFYEKMKVPPPTFCVECREQRRLAFRNERALYKRKCDLCGKMVVARVSPDKPYPMYCQECWWSDKWDPMQYGRAYDFSRPFFEQYKELLNATPHVSLLNSNMVNSEWANQETDDKNCYLNVGGHFNEDSAYNTFELNGRDSFDNYWVMRPELCYESVNCDRCYRTLFSTECFDCRDAVLSYDCRNCLNVFGCAGLRNKQYYIFNVPHTKEEYETFLAENRLSSRAKLAELAKKAEAVWMRSPRRYALIIKTSRATGNFITESKNAENCWNAERVEDCKNLYIGVDMKDSQDCSTIGWGELNYEGAHCGGLYNSKFFLFMFGGGNVKGRNSSFLEYCYATITSNNCFGCANFRSKQYCILNKQYTKEEYEALVPKIKKQMEEMPYVVATSDTRPARTTNAVQSGGQATRKIEYRYGEFFPVDLSPFGYNETVAQEYFPLTKEQALARGYPWSEYDAATHYAFSDYTVPDDIADVKDDILEKVLKCEVSGKAYRIIPMELAFYRRMSLPVPSKSPLERHKERMAKLLPKKLFERQCQCAGKTNNSPLTTDNGESGHKSKYVNTATHFHGENPCPNTFKTPYSPERPEIVYCEQCYQAEVA